jgi:hypothetical protein
MFAYTLTLSGSNTSLSSGGITSGSPWAQLPDNGPADTAGTNWQGPFESFATYASNASVSFGGSDWKATTAISAGQGNPGVAPTQSRNIIYYEATGVVIGPGTYSGTMDGGGYNSDDQNSVDWYIFDAPPGTVIDGSITGGVPVHWEAFDSSETPSWNAAIADSYSSSFSFTMGGSGSAWVEIGDYGYGGLFDYEVTWSGAGITSSATPWQQLP